MRLFVQNGWGEVTVRFRRGAGGGISAPVFFGGPRAPTMRMVLHRI